MTHPQNSPRGLFSKKTIEIDGNTIEGNSTGVQLENGLALSGQSGYIAQSASGVILPTGLSLSAQTDYHTANSTASWIFPSTAVLPSTRVVGGLVFVSNSTGKALAYHSTGTTWLYMSGTSVLA